jgi:hypothetical protein
MGLVGKMAERQRQTRERNARAIERNANGTSIALGVVGTIIFLAGGILSVARGKTSGISALMIAVAIGGYTFFKFQRYREQKELERAQNRRSKQKSGKRR